MKTIYEIPEAAKTVIREYFEIPIGNKKVVAPYFMNLKKQRAGLRVMVGKGDPGEIAREMKVFAQLKGFDLSKASEKDIREFMLANNVGIDCSGYVVYILNNWLRSQGKKKLNNYLVFKSNNFLSKLKRMLRSVQNMGANTLTNESNTIKVENLNEIRPGDLIRAKGKQRNSHHVALIIEVVIEDEVIKEFTYTHSHRYYEEDNGVRIGKVKISNPNGELKDQEWLEIKDGRNWMYEDLMVEYEDNGVRRLKNVTLDYTKIIEE
ncbi:hypothetical protein KC909_02620 [Candidatus Dojkabacteria bacterium]|uniref:Uncharacterized protein n=1 Tax=Candidatus Dojkabacteria bacterium TaxID=2099670 RepID=A0A955L5T8_9BACT|nr:hypothetical protein [Candidatus Dojkabacteria bacterium]